MNDFGKMMKAAEVAGVAIYFTCLIKAVFNFLSWNVNASEFRPILDNLLSRQKNYALPALIEEAIKLQTPEYFTNEEMINNWRGKIIPWFLMETLIFVFFGFTMVILLIKSRFMTVGQDSSYQFEPVYMQKMANLIAQEVNVDIHMEKRNYDES